jgi:hypothetical protein
MAKLARFVPRFPSVRPIIIRASPKIVKAVKKHSRRKGAKSEAHRMGAIAGGLLLGMLDKSGTTLPVLPFLGKAGTAGVACIMASKWMGSRLADDMATGLLSIAAYELASKGTISGDDGGDVDGYVAGV